MYIGKNESMADGFVGCVSRVEFDDIYPLKLMFQENPPANVRAFGGAHTENFCGVEPVTHPPPIIETRPPPIVDEDKLRKAYNQIDSAILGSKKKYIKFNATEKNKIILYFRHISYSLPVPYSHGSYNCTLSITTQGRISYPRRQGR